MLAVPLALLVGSAMDPWSEPTTAYVVTEEFVSANRAPWPARRSPVAMLTLSAEVAFASAADRQAFAEALGDAFARLCACYHDESAAGGRRFRFLTGGYPVPAAASAPVPGAKS